MKHHELNLIYALIALIFIIFSVAMIRLYREQMHLNEMVSGGLMQIKEQMKAEKMISPSQMPSLMMQKVSPTKSK